MANEPNPNNNEPNSTPDTASLEEKIKALESENSKLRKSVTEASADASKHKHEKEELRKQLEARICRNRLLKQFKRIILRFLIHEKTFEISVCLFTDGFHHLINITSNSTTRDDNGKENI